jgi:hypothetical protein
MTAPSVKMLNSVSVADIDQLYAKKSDEMHRKVDQTRDAYFGFIFPVNKADLLTVAGALGIQGDVARRLYTLGRSFSTFKAPGAKATGITNHIVGTSLLALRHESLDKGLARVTDATLASLVAEHEDIIGEIAEARASWFGRIFFPVVSFCNALNVFGAQVGPKALFEVADSHGAAAMAGQRQTIRGDFGIAVWLTLLGKA